ncbi:MAG: hypothetical protein ACLUFV_13865 [Acutalibacteraceae bacterium]
MDQNAVVLRLQLLDVGLRFELLVRQVGKQRLQLRRPFVVGGAVDGQLLGQRSALREIGFVLRLGGLDVLRRARDVIDDGIIIL